ncbi:MAG: DUF4160 domain-containing protein [Acidobacteriota bacterium]
MGTLQRIGKLKIAVYPGDHGVPHAHVIGPGFRCSLDVATLEVLAGSASPKTLAVAREWIAANRHLVLAAWKELNP